ncbi:MAG: histidine triad protein, partial [Humibacillus sp.]|nr:histidine triad protein [Humibacillus sp.]
DHPDRSTVAPRPDPATRDGAAAGPHQATRSHPAADAHDRLHLATASGADAHRSPVDARASGPDQEAPAAAHPAAAALTPMDCIFCSIVSGDLPADVVLDEPDLLGFLDRRPVFKGHVLLVPRVHVDTLLELPTDLHATVLGATQRLARAAVEALGAQGTFVAMNNVVSQSVPHLHVHVMPRTKGDGLRGFFWPRTTYSSAEESAGYAARLAEALEGA